MLKGVGHKCEPASTLPTGEGIGKTLIALPIAESQGFTGSERQQLMSQQL